MRHLNGGHPIWLLSHGLTSVSRLFAFPAQVATNPRGWCPPYDP